MTVALIAGGSILAFLGGRYLLGLSSIAKNIVITQNVKSKITARDPFIGVIPTEMTLSVDLLIKNPTPNSVKIKFPFIAIDLVKDDVKGPFTSSAYSNKDFVIPEFGQVQLDTIQIPFNLKNVALKAPAILAGAKKNKKLGIYITTTTFIDNKIKIVKPDFKEIGL